MKKKTMSFGIFANFSRISAAVKNSESIARATAAAAAAAAAATGAGQQNGKPVH